MRSRALQSTLAGTLVIGIISLIAPMAGAATATTVPLVTFAETGASAWLQAGQGTKASIESTETQNSTEGMQLVIAQGGNPSATGSGSNFVWISLPKTTNLSGDATLNLWVDDTQGANTVYVGLKDTSGKVKALWSPGKSTHNQWVELQIPMDAFTGVNLGAISAVGLGEYNAGTYYFDDLTTTPAPPTIAKPIVSLSSLAPSAVTGGAGAKAAMETLVVKNAKDGLSLTVATSGSPSTAGANSALITLAQPLNLSSASSLNFWVFDTEGNNTVYVTLGDTSGKKAGAWTVGSSVQDNWVQLSLPLSAFSGINLGAISTIELGEWNAGTYYFSNLTASYPATATTSVSAAPSPATSTKTSTTLPKTGGNQAMFAGLFLALCGGTLLVLRRSLTER